MEHTPYDDTQMLQEQNPLYIQTTVAIGKALLKGLPRMNKVKIKLLFIMLEHINWQGNDNSNIIIIDNQLAKARIRWTIKNDAIVAKRVRDSFKSMMEKCMITVQKDNDTRKEIPLILDVYGNKSYTAVAVNPAFMDQMSSLPVYKQYFRFNIEDIMDFRSQHSIYLYIELRRRQRYRHHIPLLTDVRFSTKQLKDIMGLRRESYTNKKSAKGHFYRPKLEEYVLQKALDEIIHSRMIELFPPLQELEEGSSPWYRKTKYNGRVKYYHIRFRVREELFDNTYGNYVNGTRFHEIAQGFAPESEKKKYRTWLEGLRQMMIR